MPFPARVSYTRLIVDAPTDTPAGGTVVNSLVEEFAPGAEPAQPLWAAPAAWGPDNPPWGVGAALLVWVASVLLLLFVPTLAGVGYIITRLNRVPADKIGVTLLNDPNFILTSVVAVIPAHALTFGLVWWLVTDYGKRSFRDMTGWRWSRRLGSLEFFACLGITGLLFICNIVIAYFFKGGETDLEKIISSSLAARIVVVLLATLSAPLVEEAVYRGVLYPALARAISAVWAVPTVAGLFALVHVYQYRANSGVILAITLLSLTLTLVRAQTGRLLPCVVVHLLFNGVTSAAILREVFVRSQSPPAEPTGLLLAALGRMVGFTL